MIITRLIRTAGRADAYSGEPVRLLLCPVFVFLGALNMALAVDAAAAWQMALGLGLVAFGMRLWFQLGYGADTRRRTVRWGLLGRHHFSGLGLLIHHKSRHHRAP